MDLTATRSQDVVIYIEDLYEGDLKLDDATQIDAIPWANWLQTWMQSLSRETSIDRDCEISLRFCSDSQIQAFNFQYRSLDKPTDVLAFAAMESEIVIPIEVEEPLYLGDIVISLDTASRQAQEQNHSLVTELAWLSSHGLLHLLGWDHPDDLSLKQMLERQSQLIQLLKI